jgi:hypothetical protein
MNDLTRLQQLAGILKEEPETGDEVVKTVVGHVDDEPDMLRKELYKIGKYAVELHKMLKEVPNGDLPQWWADKIVRAGDYISTAKHYLEAELNNPGEEVAVSAGVQDNTDPSGVS